MPDTLEGRFEALCLHVILALRGAARLPPPAADVAQDLADAFFRDLDASLREMGVGDTVVPKRMKSWPRPSTAGPGPMTLRSTAGDEAALAVALGRNVSVRASIRAGALARYALAADRRIRAGAMLDAILMPMAFAFPPPDAFTGEA